MEEINYRLQSAQSAPPPPTIMARLQSAPQSASPPPTIMARFQSAPQSAPQSDSPPPINMARFQQSAPQSGSPPPINMARFQIAPQSAPPPPTIMARFQSAPQSAPPPPTIMARLQSAPQSAPQPPTSMANRDNINSSPNSRDPRDINSWNQNVQILPEKAIISNSEPSGVGMVGGGGVGNSNIRGAGKQKPYACTYCEKKFSHVHLMKQHVRIHTGEKPFACKYCEKRFTQSHSVKGQKISNANFLAKRTKFAAFCPRDLKWVKHKEIYIINKTIPVSIALMFGLYIYLTHFRPYGRNWAKKISFFGRSETKKNRF